MPPALSKDQVKFLAKYLNLDEAKILTEPSLYTSIDQNIKQKLNLISQGYPVSFLTKEIWFFGYPFYIEEGVFIPRCESEFLIESVLKEFRPTASNFRALDLCCGCGVLGITIARELGCEIHFADFEEKALAVTKKNIERHQLSRAFTHKVDILKGIRLKKKFNLILCNPPYLDYNNYSGSLTYEPIKALCCSEFGSSLTKTIFKYLRNLLIKGGCAFFETASCLVSTLSKQAKLNGFKFDILTIFNKLCFFKVSL